MPGEMRRGLIVEHRALAACYSAQRDAIIMANHIHFCRCLLLTRRAEQSAAMLLQRWRSEA